MYIIRSIIIICLTIVIINCGKGESNNEVKDKLFITLPAKDSLLIFDPQTQTELSRIKLGKLPHNMRMSRDGSKVYIAIVGSQSIAEVNVQTAELLRTILTDTVPMENLDGSPIQAHETQQAATHNTCFDCHNGNADGVKPAVVGSRPFGLALTENNQIIVANSFSKTVNYIDLSTTEIVKSINIEPSGDAHEPTELAILEGRLYVTVRPTLPSLSSAELRVYDLDSGILLSQSPAGSAVSDVKVDQTNAFIYTSNFDNNTLDKFGEDAELIESFTVGNGPFGIKLAGDMLLTANYYNNSISKIDFNENTIVSRELKLDAQLFPNPTHISYSLNNETIYLVSAGTKGFLLTLDSTNLSILNSIEIDSLPFDILNVNKGERK